MLQRPDRARSSTARLPRRGHPVEDVRRRTVGARRRSRRRMRRSGTDMTLELPATRPALPDSDRGRRRVTSVARAAGWTSKSKSCTGSPLGTDVGHQVAQRRGRGVRVAQGTHERGDLPQLVVGHLHRVLRELVRTLDAPEPSGRAAHAATGRAVRSCTHPTDSYMRWWCRMASSRQTKAPLCMNVGW